MKIWKMLDVDPTTQDMREPLAKLDENGEYQLVDEQELASIGIFCKHLPAEQAWRSDLDQICKERSYKNRDEITVSPERIPNYADKLKIFCTEHLHTDEEIRFVLDGSGYFDVRNWQDEWLRIAVSKGDLVILPAGIYHRFTTDKHDFIHALRLFKDEPVWTPLNRQDPSTDLEPSRRGYLATRAATF